MSMHTSPVRSASIKIKDKIVMMIEMPIARAPSSPFLRDPITSSRRERIEHYRAQSARYRQMADWEEHLSVREGLLDLAHQCDAMADALEDN